MLTSGLSFSMARITMQVVVGFLALFLSGCASEFFVDEGHVDVVAGVAFKILPPHLFVKKAFKLRDENLDGAQLQTLRDAMPAIAAFTQQLLSTASASHMQASAEPEVRSIRRIQNLDVQTPLYVRTLKNWQVTEADIQFTTDYFYTQQGQPTVNFRDNYRFAKTRHGWQFAGHPSAIPDGVLACHKANSGWMQCDAEGSTVQPLSVQAAPSFAL